MEAFEANKIKIVLKTTLKNQAKTYEQLAAYLECSVSTVKRFMGKEDITLSRLLKICNFLKITFGDLEKLTSNIKDDNYQITNEQFDFLRDNPSHFSFLMQILSDKSAKDIEKEFNLNKSSVGKYLIDLEKIGLLESYEDKLKINCKGLVLDKSSKLAKVYLSNCIKASCDMYKNIIQEKESQQLHNKKNNSPMTYATLVLKLSEDSLQEWIEEQEKSYELLRQKSKFEKNTLASDDLKTIVISQSTYSTVDNDHHLKKFNEVWGEIINIY